VDNSENSRILGLVLILGLVYCELLMRGNIENSRISGLVLILGLVYFKLLSAGNIEKATVNFAER
jgi:succinate-acetate transporter protein